MTANQINVGAIYLTSDGQMVKCLSKNNDGYLTVIDQDKQNFYVHPSNLPEQREVWEHLYPDNLRYAAYDNRVGYGEELEISMGVCGIFTSSTNSELGYILFTELFDGEITLTKL